MYFNQICDTPYGTLQDIYQPFYDVTYSGNLYPTPSQIIIYT